MYSILFAILILIFTIYWKNLEGFYDPYFDKTRNSYMFPDNNYDSNLVMMSKLCYDLYKSNNISKNQKKYLEDLLNLIQFI
jgi:hypothetical protein